LKVQDGCDYFCSFCTIPLARGRSRSASIEQVLEQAYEIAQLGVKEVVLTGVNIGDFGAGQSYDFLDLIKELDNVDGIDRFRISSIEPNLLNDKIIDFVATSNRFAPHFHIPLQSGSDELLESMRRRYDTNLYRNRIEKIKKVMPDACIGVDVITGYPGESDAHFKRTTDFIMDLDVSYLHVFTYSERANTSAPRKEGIVPVNIRRERSRKLQEISRKLKRQYYSKYAGRSMEVLFEKEEDGFISGFTPNYIRVKVPANLAEENSLKTMELKEINADDVMLSEKINQLMEAPV
jgi:threonylcarbamoyladenosine tRNA methylthiotransferase MtaB